MSESKESSAVNIGEVIHISQVNTVINSKNINELREYIRKITLSIGDPFLCESDKSEEIEVW